MRYDYQSVMVQHKLSAFLLLITSLYFLGCSSPNETTDRPGSPKPATVTSTVPSPLDIHYAQGFNISYRDGYKLLSVINATDTTRYALAPQGAPLPDHVPTATTVIRTPIQRLVVTSTTHLGLVDFLQAEDRLVGIDNADWVYSKNIRERVANGQIQQVGVGGELNWESILALSPDLVMVSGMPGVGLGRYQTLQDAGIPVIINSEWMEPTPLGKAEWVKLLAVLLNQEALVQEKFAQVVTAYDSVAALARTVKQKPLVVTGAPYQGAWFVPGGHSFLGKLLQDAGATWPWEQDTSATSISVAFETIYPYGLRADYWLHPGQGQDRSALQAQDERLADFQPYQQGTIYNNDRRSKGLSNDYYESGVVHPEVVLADMIEIFHHDLLDHKLYYYQKLE